MLKDILNRLLGHTVAPPAPAQPQQPQQKTDLPNYGALSAAIAKYKNNLPMDNLDGTFSNQPVNTAIFQNGGNWQAPLLPGKTMPKGIAHFDPLNTTDRYTDDQYPVLPINPASVPALKSYLPYIQQGGAQ